MGESTPEPMRSTGHQDSRALTWAFVPAILFCLPFVPLVGLVLATIGFVRRRRDGGSAPFVAVVVIAIVCSGMQAIFLLGAFRPGEHSSTGPDASRDSQGQVTSSGDASVENLRVGDCFTDEGEPEPVDGSGLQDVADVVALPCSKPHTDEVFDQYPLQGDVYPGTAQLSRAAAAGCSRAFVGFVGVPARHSSLRFDLYFPSSQSWDSDPDRRDVTCVVYDPTLDVTGTLRDADR